MWTRIQLFSFSFFLVSRCFIISPLSWVQFTYRIHLTHTPRPETTICRTYKCLFRAGIEPATGSAVDCSATAPNVKGRQMQAVPLHICSQELSMTEIRKTVCSTAKGSCVTKTVQPYVVSGRKESWPRGRCCSPTVWSTTKSSGSTALRLIEGMIIYFLLFIVERFL